MVISKETIKRIKDIIDKNYKQLTISVLGKDIFTPDELAKLMIQGVDISNKQSLLDLVYNHNFLNQHGEIIAPTSVGDMAAQQSPVGVKPQGEAHDYAIEHANENAAQLIEKMKGDISTRVEGIIRETNSQYKANALQNLDRPDATDELIKEGMVGQIKQRLRDTSGDANRDWKRIAVTEVSNSIGIASTDRIVAKNKEKDLEDVYVFKIPVNDSKLCKYCRRFWLDSDDSPKVYRLSTLLSYGSNYGKKTSEWRPTIQSTHPNDRESMVIELSPGYKVLSGGKLTYIGLDEWSNYIVEKLVA